MKVTLLRKVRKRYEWKFKGEFLYVKDKKTNEVENFHWVLFSSSLMLNFCVSIIGVHSGITYYTQHEKKHALNRFNLID